MRRHTAAGGKHSLRRIHSADIIGTGLDAAQHNPLAALFPLDGVIGIKNDATRGSPWTRGQALAEQISLFMSFFLRLLIEDRAQ